MGVLFLASAIRNTLAGQFAGKIDPKNIATLPAQYSYLFSWSTLVGTRDAGSHAALEAPHSRREATLR
jgi:hypothetical protein